MRHRDHGAGKPPQKLLEPLDAFCVEVIGGLIEQQDIGLGEQQPAQRNPAFLAAGERTNLDVPRRKAQRVGGDVHLQIGAVRVHCVDDRLEFRLLGGELVEVGVGFRVRRIDLIETLFRLQRFAQALLHRLAHGFFRIQLRLLRQETDLHIRHRDDFALEIRLHPGHDLQQRGFPRAVQAEHADLRAGEKVERDVLENLALGRDGLADPAQGVDVLSHGRFSERANFTALAQRLLAFPAGAVVWAILQTG